MITPFASEESLAALKQAAADLRAAVRKGDTPAYNPIAQRLMQAAVDWRESAIANAAAQGVPPKERPKFTVPPDNDVLRGFRLQWWASKYAWDKADGLPLEDSAKALIGAAISKNPRKKKKGLTPALPQV